VTSDSEEAELTPVLVRLLEGRVGSTVMMQLLGTSPAIAFDRVYAFQNSYLTYFVRLISQMERQEVAGPQIAEWVYGSDLPVGPLPFKPELVGASDLARASLRAVWSAFSRSVQARATSPVSWYAEKYWGRLAPVLEAGLTPVVIDMVRDPRDVVASIRAFNAKLDMKLFGRAQAADDDEHLRRLTMNMVLRLHEMEAPLPVPRLLVRYEDLVSDLRGQASDVSALLGVELDPQAVTAAQSSMSRHITAPSVATSVGRWRADLSQDEVATIERRLGKQMTRLGYAPSLVG